MESNTEAGFQILQDQLDIQDKEIVDYGKQLTENLLKIFTDFTGVHNENEDEHQQGFTGSPFKQVTQESPLRRRKTSEFNKNMLEKYDRSEKELMDLKKHSKEQEIKIIDLEAQNHLLQSKLETSTLDLEKMKFEMEDFKKRANIGLTEILELELNQKKEQVAMLTSKLEEKQKEYQRKIEDYHDKYEENRRRINELEEYRAKYDELKANQTNTPAKTETTNDELREEYER